MTTVSRPSRSDLIERRAQILRSLELTPEQFADKKAARHLVGGEWAAAAELEKIDYLLEGA